MSIYRTTNPAEFADVDGIIINESAPAPNVQGVAANTAILIGQFQRGPATLTEVGSIGELHEVFGKSDFSGNLALKNKRFGRLKIVRVVAAAAVKASKAFQSSTTDRISFTAKFKGTYGNLIKVTIENGSTIGKKYTIQDSNPDAVLPVEVYDNIEIASVTASTFASSRLVDVAVLSSVAEPSNAVATALASGAEGTIADTDYQAAIALTEVENAGNVLFLDTYNSTRNGYLKATLLNAPDKMVICAGGNGDTVSAAVADVANCRDTEGRIIYAYPWVKTTINGIDTPTSPASWVASIFSQVAQNVDLAYAANAGLMAGATGLVSNMTRAQYIQLKQAGISAFEVDSDIGIKLKSAIVTQIANSSKLTILRRRMTDYLTDSAAKFLKNYQNAPNTKENRTAVKAALEAFIASNQRDKVLPNNSEVKTGLASIVDTESLNTDDSIAAGFFKILWKQRIYSSMRFIVMQAEIGESVVVTDQG